MPAPVHHDPAAVQALAQVGSVFTFLFGACVGSFVNVVAHRLPLGLSVVKPRSRCPACRTPVRALDNLPIVSWFLLRGRCRGCAGRISPRYAAVEAFAGAMSLHAFWVAVLRPGDVPDPAAWAHWAALLLFGATLLAASLIDLDLRILPDRITKSGMAAAPFVALAVPRLLFGPELERPEWLAEVPLRAATIFWSLAGIAAGAGLIAGVRSLGTFVFRKEAMGRGDIKLMGLIGGAVGPFGTLLTLVLASFVGAVLGLANRVITGDKYIPFGPFLALGAWAAATHGDELVAAYLAHLGV